MNHDRASVPKSSPRMRAANPNSIVHGDERRARDERDSRSNSAPAETVPAVTAEQVALAGATYEADYGLEGATLLQCADEIHVVIEALFNGCAQGLVATALMGIAGRMKMAARVAEEAP